MWTSLGWFCWEFSVPARSGCLFSFPRFGKISAIISSNKFSAPLFSFLPHFTLQGMSLVGRTDQKWQRQERIREITRNFNRTSNKMSLNTYLLIITLKENGLNALIKRYRISEWIKNKTYLYAAYKRCILDLKTRADWKWGDEETSIILMDIKRKLE